MRASFRRAVRGGTTLLAAGCTVLWWAALWRLAVRPEQAGLLEAALAGGGWGLSLLPVHATLAHRTTWSGVLGTVRLRLSARRTDRVTRRAGPVAEGPTGSRDTST